MAEREIQAIMIVEVAGKPAEYVKQGLEIHVAKLDQMPGVEVISKNFSEPKKIENQEAYTCFSEIEFKVPTFQKLLDLIFDFMPSSIEIIHPGRIELDSQEATMFVNNMTGRLHRYDEVAKIAQFKINQLVNQINLMKQQPQEKPEEKKTPKTKKKAKKKSKS